MDCAQIPNMIGRVLVLITHITLPFWFNSNNMLAGPTQKIDHSLLVNKKAKRKFKKSRV